MSATNGTGIIKTGEKLFDDVHAFTERYVGWTPEFRVGAVAWILGTHVFQRFQHFPYLQFVGPRGKGKTRSLDVLKNLTYRPENFACATAAVLFRLDGQTGGCRLLLAETAA